jgi:hypothetical protein
MTQTPNVTVVRPRRVRRGGTEMLVPTITSLLMRLRSITIVKNIHRYKLVDNDNTVLPSSEWSHEELNSI